MPRHLRSRRAAGVLLAPSLVLLAAAPGRAVAGDAPPGFWYGTDSSTVAVSGSPPYTEPVIGGSYGGYLGMDGDWADWQGCGDYQLAWSPTDAADADTDFTRYGLGIGTGAYWFMAGPGVDPHYNATTAEAYQWGQEQGARILSDLKGVDAPYPVVFMDVELPGSTVFDPAPDNGWNDVYSPACSGHVAATYIAPDVDRADLNGFAAWIVAHSTRKVGVYSSPSAWAAIFGTGSDSVITNTYEWTYAPATSSLRPSPYAWCLSGTSTCAQFFGSITSSSPYALMWQWSGGGGTRNGVGDFDQIDANSIR